jgi:hypothetical protein
MKYMAKKAEQQRLSDRAGVTLERNSIIYDDSLFPPADELMSWLLTCKQKYAHFI